MPRQCVSNDPGIMPESSSMRKRCVPLRVHSDGVGGHGGDLGARIWMVLSWGPVLVCVCVRVCMCVYVFLAALNSSPHIEEIVGLYRDRQHLVCMCVYVCVRVCMCVYVTLPHSAHRPV